MTFIDIFKDEPIILNTFGHQLNKIKNIQMSTDSIKATPIDEILQKLNIDVVLDKTLSHGYIETNTFVINQFDNLYRQRFTKAILLGQKLQPSASDRVMNHFAANLLLPSNQIKKAITQWLPNPNETSIDSDAYQKLLKSLQDTFLIHADAIDIRLHQLDIVNPY